MEFDEESFKKEKPNFENCLFIINEELLKRKGKWRLTAIAWMDFDDVCQKIRLHIFNKWSQWDNARPIRPWLNTIITNQITNLIRNNYSSFSKPCSQCKYNLGGNLCEIYGTQNNSCAIYSKWESCKKNAYDIKMPVSIHENLYDNNESSGSQSAMDIPDSDAYIDYDSKIGNFHKKIKEKLSVVEWKVYNYLYVENKNEIETAQAMGYKTTEKNRSPGYKQIKKIKNKIYKIAKTLIYDIS
jgi:hypothetical protein